MAIDANDGRRSNDGSPIGETPRNLQPHRQPSASADTGCGEYDASVWTGDGVFDRGAEFPRLPDGRRSPEGREPEHPGDRQGSPLPACPMSGSTGDTAFAIS